MADPRIVAKVRALMTRATDPGCSEEEQRSSAHIAAKLCKEHGIDVAELADGEPVHERAEVAIGGMRMVVETVRSVKPGLDAALGFDVFAFAQGMLRDRVQEAISSAIKPAAVAKRPRARKRAK